MCRTKAGRGRFRARIEEPLPRQLLAELPQGQFQAPMPLGSMSSMINW